MALKRSNVTIALSRFNLKWRRLHAVYDLHKRPLLVRMYPFAHVLQWLFAGENSSFALVMRHLVHVFMVRKVSGWFSISGIHFPDVSRRRSFFLHEWGRMSGGG